MSAVRLIYICLVVLLLFGKKDISAFHNNKAIKVILRTDDNNKFINTKYHAVINNLATESDKDMPTRRKDHKNKYATFSKKEADPLIKLMELQRKNEEAVGTAKIKAPIRGTTVPTQPKVAPKVASISTKLPTSKRSKLTERSSTDNIDPYNTPIEEKNISDIETTANDTTVPRRLLFTPAKVRLIQPSDPYTFGYIEIGRVLKSHGVRGELKFYATADTIDDLKLGGHSIVYIKKPSRRTPRPIQLISIRKQIGNQYLLTFEGVNTRDLAEGLRDYTVYIKHENRPELVDDEYMIRDLVGMLCYKLKTEKNMHPLPGSTQDGGPSGSAIPMINSDDYRDEVAVGVVEGVVPPDELCSPEMAKLMHSILEIKFYHNEELCLIPLVPSIVRHVDVANRVVVIDPPDGLLDLTYSETKKYVLRGYLPARCESLTDEMRRHLASATVFVSTLPPLIPL